MLLIISGERHEEERTYEEKRRRKEKEVVFLRMKDGVNAPSSRNVIHLRMQFLPSLETF